jgi:hypothetical protein
LSTPVRAGGIRQAAYRFCGELRAHSSQGRSIVPIG